MGKLKLLCSYEEWKQNKHNVGAINGASDDTDRLLFLMAKSLTFGAPLSKEEEQEKDKLYEQQETKNLCKQYTDKVHSITDVYINLKDVHNNDKRQQIYKKIGRMQCELEVMKERYGIAEC